MNPRADEVLVELRQAVIGHGREAVAGPLELRLRRGEFLLVAGPNGAGKSTLVKTLMGVLPPLAGTRAASADGRSTTFGYVPQRERLDDLWPFSVLDIARMGLVPSLRPFQPFGAAGRRRAEGLLERVGLGDVAARPFRELSGGQQQRALIARALVSTPDVLVLDEPTNHLDVPGERAVYELLARLHRERARGALVVITHHLDPVLDHASRALVMRPGGGVEEGPIDALLESGALDELLARGARRGAREAAT